MAKQNYSKWKMEWKGKITLANRRNEFSLFFFRSGTDTGTFEDEKHKSIWRESICTDTNSTNWMRPKFHFHIYYSIEIEQNINVNFLLYSWDRKKSFAKLNKIIVSIEFFSSLSKTYLFRSIAMKMETYLGVRLANCSFFSLNIFGM